MKFIRKIVVFSLLMLTVGAIGKLWHFSKDGFNLNRIRFALPPVTADACTPPRDLLNGPYRYLGRGRQCYAFESSDGLTVLKIPRFDRYDLPFRWKWPFAFLEKWRAPILEDRQKRLIFTMESFRIAQQELKKDTALLYSHFHETEDLPRSVPIYDRLGRRFEINLNQTAFVLQEKKPLMMPQFLEALEEQDRDKAMQILDSFLTIIERRARLGIFNKDPSFLKNFSWEEGRGVQIDIGSFYRKTDCIDEKQIYQRSLLDSCGPIREWLAQLDSELLKRFEKRFSELMEKECDSAP